MGWPVPSTSPESTECVPVGHSSGPPVKVEAGIQTPSVLGSPIIPVAWQTEFELAHPVCVTGSQVSRHAAWKQVPEIKLEPQSKLQESRSEAPAQATPLGDTH